VIRHLHVALVLILLTPVLSEASVESLRGLPASEITPGLRGYGLSCFNGTEPVRLDVEILGIMKNNPPGSFTILGKVAGDAVDRGGIMSGMSGSPVYIGERLIGAMAFAFPFAKEAICGITPIQDMNALWTQPISSLPAVNAPSVSRTLIGQPGKEFEQQAVRIGLPLFNQGIDASVFSELNPTAGLAETSISLSSPAGGAANLNAPLLPGCPVGVAFIDGDLKLAAMGTITSIEEDRILAFGHSLFTAGDCRLPMISGEIVTFIPSVAQSFKIGNIGHVIGSIVRDLRPGVAGRIALEPDMIPMEIRYSDPHRGDRDYHVRVLREDRITGVYAAIAVGSVVSHLGPASGAIALDLGMTISLEGHDPLHLRRLVGESDTPAADIFRFMDLLTVLLTNPIESIRIRKLEVDVIVREDIRVILLEHATMMSKSAEPGDSIGLKLDFKDYRRPIDSRFVSIDIPSDAIPGEYSVRVLDESGYRNWRVTREPDLYFQPGIDGFIDMLTRSGNGDELVILLCRKSRALDQGRSTLPDLPPTLERTAILSGQESSLRVQDHVVSQQILRFPMQISGSESIELRVSRSSKR